MLGPQGFFADVETALYERLCLGVAALRSVRFGEIGERCADVRVLWPRAFFATTRLRLAKGTASE
jgi:hypothetical protein